ncbi:hypothetical protein [Sulfurospirillum multivorans]|uniref:Uncharacterized protein n=2 Tax=Sulfurospirillum multivorans TaxID=66821 RepID=A0AA86AKU5_SULMK|nr:hypothetical protein [Sulfurospirillum multivorans]AHJ12436.1 hypothetical protein SMUL_1171 [Sulfurospirillum multivorans DSM 12446]QEH05931.1 hypothetical protein SMN_1158 [Sulfurospirillum multivorans]
MKKILLALMMFSSFLFSGSPVPATYEGNDIYKAEGVCRKIGVWHDWSSGTTGYSAYNFEVGYIVIADFAKNQVNYYLYTDAICPVPTPTCTADQDLVAGVCVPKCPTGSHVDSDLNLCMGDYNQTKTTFDNGNFIVYFSDGAEMYCDVSEEKCITHDKNFNVIPNRFLNPNLNPDGTVGSVQDSVSTSDNS